MGLTSFLTNDTKRSIPHAGSKRRTFPVYMKDNKDNVWIENYYEGYAVFGGKDFFELVDEMNGGSGDREVGIEMYYSPNNLMKFPNLLQDKNIEWKNERPEQDKFQGHFY